MDFIVICETCKEIKTKSIVDCNINYSSAYSINELIENNELDILADNLRSNSKVAILNGDTKRIMFGTLLAIAKETYVKIGIIKQPVRMLSNSEYNREVDTLLQICTPKMRKFLLRQLIGLKTYSVTSSALTDAKTKLVKKYIRELDEMIEEEDGNDFDIQIYKFVSKYGIEVSDKSKKIIGHKLNCVIREILPIEIDKNCVKFISEDSKDIIKLNRFLHKYVKKCIGLERDTTIKDSYNSDIDDRPIIIKMNEFKELYTRMIDEILYESSISNISDTVENLIKYIGNRDFTTLVIERLINKLRVETQQLLGRLGVNKIKQLPFPEALLSHKLGFSHMNAQSKSNIDNFLSYVKKLIDEGIINPIEDFEKYQSITLKEKKYLILSKSSIELTFMNLETYMNKDEYDNEFIEKTLSNKLWSDTCGIDDLRHIIYTFERMGCKDMQDIVVRSILRASCKLRRDSCKKIVNLLMDSLREISCETKHLFARNSYKDNRKYMIAMMREIDNEKLNQIISDFIMEGCGV